MRVHAVHGSSWRVHRLHTFGEDTKTYKTAGYKLGGEGISSHMNGSEDKLVRCGQYITEQMQSEVDEKENEDLEQNPFAEFDLED